MEGTIPLARAGSRFVSAHHGWRLVVARSSGVNRTGPADYELIPLGTFNPRPSLIARGQDGTLWFTVQYGDSIWKVPPNGHPIEVLSLPAGSHPFGITTTPDGSVWFTEGEADGSSGDAVGRLNPDGTLAHRTTFPDGSEPTGLAIGADGRVWVTAYGERAVYWLSQDGREMGGPFHVDGNPNRIVVGPDGNIWVTIATRPRVVVLSNDGVQIRDYLVVPNPTDIIVAADGKVWITSHDSNSLQWIDATSGVVSQPREVLGGPGALILGPDGNFWFTQLSSRAVTVLSPTGDILRTLPIPGGSRSESRTDPTMPSGSPWVTSTDVVYDHHHVNLGDLFTPPWPGRCRWSCHRALRR